MGGYEQGKKTGGLRKEARDPERRFLEAAATMWGPEDVEDPSGRRKGPLPVPAPKSNCQDMRRVTDHLRSTVWMTRASH